MLSSMHQFSLSCDSKQLGNVHLLIAVKQLLVAAGANMRAQNTNGYAIASPS